MIKKILLVGLPMILLLSGQNSFARDKTEPSANGIQLPTDYKNWRVIGTSHRTDNNTLRVIIGNTIAIKAARSGQTQPWPKGSILGKLVWKDKQHPDWSKATVPGKLSHIEFMIKNSTKYKTTGGWGYARWIGMNAVPYGKDANFAQECFACHGAVKANDYVFTQPVQLP